MKLQAVCILLFVASAAQAACGCNNGDWQATVDRIAQSVVSIQVDVPRAFDTESNTSGQATGFVVDAKHGLILTNRHVVQPGPAVARAIFRNQETVPLTVVYRDPVHDFGLLHYDPAALKFIHPKALRLNPSAATVGTDLRVVGNDAGEQLSILAGTLARIDRAAPDYGRGNYNDFNTFYLQAASGTSGGSSGSPVIDANGDVIGINAGGKVNAASSFYLPLNRVVRALRLIEKGGPVTRGTLETIFRHLDYAALDRLGLQAATEASFRKRNPDENGMLVVSEVLPGGPADGHLQPGDILLRLNGKPLTTFVTLENILDDAVGRLVSVTVERGGRVLHTQLRVQNLHDITPDSYLEFGGAVLNRLSYQQALSLYRAPHGIYVASPGYVLETAGVPRGAVIDAVNGKPVRDINDIQAILEKLPQAAHASLRYITFGDPTDQQTAIMRMDWRWFPAQRCILNSATGYWPCTRLRRPQDGQSLQPVTVSYPRYQDERARKLAASLVFINFDMPYEIDGTPDTHYSGSGVIVDAGHGLVVTDRNTIPVAMGDVRLTFAGALEIPGKVVYIDPLHNLALVSYDPRLLGKTPVRSVEFSSRPLQQGEPVWVVGFQPDGTLTSQATDVSAINPLRLPLSSTLRFRDSNLDVAEVSNAPQFVSGILADSDGRMQALWASFAYQNSGQSIHEAMGGIANKPIQQMLAIAKSKVEHELRTLDVEYQITPLSSARKMGLPDNWVSRLSAKETNSRQALEIDRITIDSPASRRLQVGDLLLAVNDKLVTTFAQESLATQQPQVKLTILRNGKLKNIEVRTVALNGRGTTRVLVWAGALLQKPHRAVAVQRHMPRSGVLVGYYNYGSPASHYGLSSGSRIVAVDGRPTPNLDRFIRQVKNKRDGQSVRLTTVNWQGRTNVVTLLLDLHYWPTYEIKREDGKWMRKGVDPP